MRREDIEFDYENFLDKAKSYRKATKLEVELQRGAEDLEKYGACRCAELMRTLHFLRGLHSRSTLPHLDVLI